MKSALCRRSQVVESRFVRLNFNEVFLGTPTGSDPWGLQADNPKAPRVATRGRSRRESVMNPPEIPESHRAQSGHVEPDLERYNRVTDTVSGLNIRLKDNLIQVAVILVCAAGGAVIAMNRWQGAERVWIIGAIVGGIAGVFI